MYAPVMAAGGEVSALLHKKGSQIAKAPFPILASAEIQTVVTENPGSRRHGKHFKRPPVSYLGCLLR